MKHIVVDLEMNVLGKNYKKEKALCSMEIIEIGAVVLDEEYQEIGSFKTLVKPQYNDVIKPYYEKLTGITTEMVSNAPVFEDALKMFCSWCKSYNDEIAIYQWSETDLDQIIAETKMKNIIFTPDKQYFFSEWADFQKEFGEKLNLSNAVSLKNAVMYAGVDFEGAEHDALDDARNTATLMKIIRTPALLEGALKNVIDVLTPTPDGIELGSMFDFAELGFIA